MTIEPYQDDRCTRYDDPEADNEKSEEGVLVRIPKSTASVSFWVYLYIAGWGIVAAIGMAVFLLILLYNPELISPGRPWTEGPWYADFTAKLSAAYVMIGMAFGSAWWFWRHWDMAFRLRRGEDGD